MNFLQAFSRKHGGRHYIATIILVWFGIKYHQLRALFGLWCGHDRHMSVLNFARYQLALKIKYMGSEQEHHRYANPGCILCWLLLTASRLND
jgi:hypothetical protein